MPDLGIFGFAFGAGLLAAFNPCGFAMLPTYLIYFLGLDSDETSTARSIFRGAKVGLALTLGFITVFGIFGVLFEVVLSAGARSAVQENLWVMTLGSGALILVLGAFMLSGYQPVLNIPKLQMGTGSRELGSMFLFGVSYGVVSLGCTMPVFLVAVTSSVSSADVVGASFLAFLVYGLGMGSVIIFLTMALAAGRSQVANKMRSLLPIINRLSGGLLILAGIYMVMFGLFERNPTGDGFVNRFVQWVEFNIQVPIVNFLNNQGTESIGLTLLGAAVIIGGAAFIWRRATNRSADDDTTPGGGAVQTS